MDNSIPSTESKEKYGKYYGEERKISIGKNILKRTSKKSVYSYQ
jgi:hypothetical protein